MDEQDIQKHSIREKLEFLSLVNMAESQHERPRGILSQADREYLNGLREYEHAQSESNRKQDIRERVVNAFQDSITLYKHLPQEERKKVFENELGEAPQNNGITGMLAFIYLGLEQDKNRFVEFIEQGVLIGANAGQSERPGGEAANVDVSIDIEYNPDLDKLQDKLRESPNRLTPSDIGVLARAGKLNSEDLERLDQRTVQRLIRK